MPDDSLSSDEDEAKNDPKTFGYGGQGINDKFSGKGAALVQAESENEEDEDEDGEDEDDDEEGEDEMDE